MTKKRRTSRASKGGVGSKRKAPDQTVVTIRTLIRGRQVEEKGSRHAPVARLAEEWTYILRSRTRWCDDRGNHGGKRRGATHDGRDLKPEVRHVEGWILFPSDRTPSDYST
jgi:hypothetical protein